MIYCFIKLLFNYVYYVANFWNFIDEFKLIRSIPFTYFTYFFCDVFFIKLEFFWLRIFPWREKNAFKYNYENVFLCAALVLLFIIKLRLPKGKNIHHIKYSSNRYHSSLISTETSSRPFSPWNNFTMICKNFIT